MLRHIYHHLVRDGSGVCLWDRKIDTLSDRELMASSLLSRLDLWIDPYEPDTDPPNREVLKDGEEPREAA